MYYCIASDNIPGILAITKDAIMFNPLESDFQISF